ncbi:MAG: hypothetical protein Kow0098_23400 [Ignavibacteriaceae bacterium]
MNVITIMILFILNLPENYLVNSSELFGFFKIIQNCEEVIILHVLNEGSQMSLNQKDGIDDM